MNTHSSIRFFDPAVSWTQGDIILFRFPYLSAENCATRAPRPCLVLDREQYYGATFVELLPGTQSLLPAPEPGDLSIDETAFIAPYDHTGTWRFIVACHERFDTCHPDFHVVDPSASQLIGRAFGTTLAMVEHLRGQLQATRELHMAEKRSRRASRHKR